MINFSTFSVRRILVLATLCLFGLQNSNACAASPDLTVNQARIRWLPGDLPMAGYMTLHNNSQHKMVLTGVICDWFGASMMHQNVEQSGMSRMAMLKNVTIAPGGTVNFAPGGYHLMLMKRQKVINVGEKIPMTLTFEDNSRLTVTFTVVGADAA